MGFFSGLYPRIGIANPASAQGQYQLKLSPQIDLTEVKKGIGSIFVPRSRAVLFPGCYYVSFDAFCFSYSPNINKV
jgi:hypothetical protein